MKHELSNVSSRFGAPMGRHSTHGDYSKRKEPIAFTLIQLQWEDGDYDTGGAYWGCSGDHIYHALADQGDSTVELFIRGKSFSDAESQLLADYPLATFARQEQETGEETFWFSTGSGRIELQLTMSQAESMSHSGQCDNDVSVNRELPSIAKQLAAINPETLRKELRECGWDADELTDHDRNLTRILWLAAGDIKENN